MGNLLIAKTNYDNENAAVKDEHSEEAGTSTSLGLVSQPHVGVYMEDKRKQDGAKWGRKPSRYRCKQLRL